MHPAVRTASTLTAVAFILGAGSALAGPVFVGLGETKVVNVSSDVKSAKAVDESLVDVRRKAGGQIVVRGKELGRTEIRMRMADGEEYVLALHVVPEGTVVYSTGRGKGGPKLERASDRPQRAAHSRSSEKNHTQKAQADAERESATGGSGPTDAGESLESWARESNR